MQYPETLPLADHEVVLTFDDGPLPPHTTHVLKTLSSECVKATFFLIGRMAKDFPETVRKVYEAGHTIGTHSQNHPLRFNRMTTEQINREVEGGIRSVAAALGDRNEISPFFRIPGLLRSPTVERYLTDQRLMTWSADFPADDWLKISDKEIANRALRRIEARGRGMLLLHDIKPHTAAALPTILHELKKRGYRIVHIAVASAEHPVTKTRSADWIGHRGHRIAWPNPPARLAAAKATLPAPDPRSFELRSMQPSGSQTVAYLAADKKKADGSSWPPVLTAPVVLADADTPALVIPSPRTFGIGKGAVPVAFAAKARKKRAAHGQSAPLYAKPPQTHTAAKPHSTRSTKKHRPTTWHRKPASARTRGTAFRQHKAAPRRSIARQHAAPPRVVAGKSQSVAKSD